MFTLLHSTAMFLEDVIREGAGTIHLPEQVHYHA